jgi:2-oxo-4-hydroxy-4-carboxy--5-ureidoimidazoline (OHCU) decarboxylase
MQSVPLADLHELNAAASDACVALLAPLFEGAPAFLARLCAERPFASDDDLFERARRIAHDLPENEQVELVDAHPRLGAPPASVSARSFAEQGYDRETTAAVDELARLNDEYERRFGFRYCTFVAGRSRPDLLPEFRERMGADRTEELRRALDAVVDIARDRYHASAGVPR